MKEFKHDLTIKELDLIANALNNLDDYLDAVPPSDSDVAEGQRLANLFKRASRVEITLHVWKDQT